VKRVVTAAGTTRSKTLLRRQQILDTAALVFAEKGIIAATVRDISERAGILSGSLYHYFASKEEMIAEILSPVIRSQVDEFDRIVAQHNDPTEILRLVIAAEIAQSAKTPQVARILRQDEHHIATLVGLDEVARQRRAMRARVESVITSGINSGQFSSDCDPRVTSLALFDLTLSAYRHLKPLGHFTTEELTIPITTLFMQGLVVAEGSRKWSTPSPGPSMSDPGKLAP
jgi:TetR/AcrR family transcriptional regulator, cholesterol catabolism regulator